MTGRRPLRMLYARLQLAVPEARTFLVAPTSSSIDCFPVARELAKLVAETGCSVRLVRVIGAAGPQPDRETEALPVPREGQSGPAGDVQVVELAESGLGRVEQLKEALDSFHDITVVSTGGLLENPVALLAARVADAVVVVARRGKTNRTELERVRIEVQRADGRIAGAVLIK